MSRLLGWPRRVFRTARRNRHAVLDWAIVVVLCSVFLIGWLFAGDERKLWAPPLELGACIALGWRRTRPVTVLAIAAAANVVALAGGASNDTVGGATLIAVYSAFGYAARRQAAIGLVATLAGLAVVSRVPWAAEAQTSWLGDAVLLAIAGLIGDNRRTRRAYVAGVEERAARLEREREVQAQIAAAQERTRIAREMHDVVAHSLAVMVAQADGAAYVVDTAPDQARRAIETVADTGRSALTEMHRLLGILRATDSDEQLAPQPGVDQLDALIARTQSAGLPVTLSVQGAPVPLSPGLSLTIYRIVQEALTNTLKHAGPAVSARVRLRYDDEAVEIDVDDDGHPSTARPDVALSSGGHGLTGMRERTAVYGGSLQAGPRPGRGWHLHARLPLEAGS